VRERESGVALRRLGISNYAAIRLRIPDGEVAHNIEGLEIKLTRLLRPDDFCLAPWEHDGHPDHDASGTASHNATRAIGSDLLYYLVWALHWADPNGDDLPWSACRRHLLPGEQRRRKRRATLAFRSQIRPLGGSSTQGAVLPPAVLRRHWLDHELFIDPTATSGNKVESGTESHKERA
ncbi:MAG: PIG-L family deacetylase, partial [Acidimicrobiales bacterium]